MRTLFAIILIFYAPWATGQFIKMDNSLLFSSFSNDADLEFLSDAITSYHFSLGLDYADKKWFHISSQAGLMTIGGREDNPLLEVHLRQVRERKGFIHLNSTFRPQLTSEQSKVFAGIGPYFNVLVGSNRLKSELYEGYDVRTHWGVKAELGVYHDVRRLRIGMTVSYLYSLSPPVSTRFLSLYSHNYGVNIALGYKAF